MNLLHLLAYVAGGALLANAVPHFVSGMMGRAFQSPFATPRGEGLSSSLVNVVWGWANLVLADLLVIHVGDFSLKSWLDSAALLIGMLAMALPMSAHFGRFHGGNLSTGR